MLSLNEDKTSTTIYFFTTQREPFETQRKKLLSIKLDSRLTWLPHIEDLTKKLSGALYALRKITSTINGEAGRITYFALFHSIMTYGLLRWGSSAHTGRVFTLQKKAVRVLEGVAADTHARPIFRKHIIPTVYSAYICIR